MQGVANFIACSLTVQRELGESVVLYPEIGLSSVDFHQWFVEAFTKFTGMDPRVDQNSPLTLATFILVFFQTVQT